MPKAKTTKRITKKDVKKNELQEKEEEKGKIENNQFSIRNCQGPITINNNYNRKAKLIEEPVDKDEHWTKNPLDDRWLYLWHCDQKIIKLQSEFYITTNWELIEKINHLFEAKKILIKEGRILETTPIEELIKLYYTGEIDKLRNYNNSYYQLTQYRFAEEEEIIETSGSHRIKGKQSTNINDHLYY